MEAPKSFDRQAAKRHDAEAILLCSWQTIYWVEISLMEAPGDEISNSVFISLDNERF